MTGPAASTVVDISHPLITEGETSGGTCKRLIGSVKLEVATATNDHILLGIGILVVTADALAAGTIPLPQSDLRQDWYFWEVQAYHLENPAAGSSDRMVKVGNIDIHTARRLREGYRLVMVVEKSVTTEVAWNVQVGLRTLWTLQA